MVFCAIRTPKIACPKTLVASHATSIIPALVTKNCKISFRDNVNISSRRRDKRKTSRKHQDRSKAVRPSAALVRRICGSPGDAAPWGRVRCGGGEGFITGRERRRLSQAPSTGPLVYIPRGHITLVAFNQTRCQIILRGFCSEC